MRACCPSIAGSSRTCSSASCWPSCICTETLAAGINLPARSVVLTSLVKGPFGKEKLIERQHGPSDFRPGRPAAVRRPRLRLRPGPRGRRQAAALEGEIRPDSRGHPRPGSAQGEEGAEAEEAGSQRDQEILERRPVQAAARRAARQALQQGPAAVAVAGLPAEGLAGCQPGPHRDPQAADG